MTCRLQIASEVSHTLLFTINNSTQTWSSWLPAVAFYPRIIPHILKRHASPAPRYDRVNRLETLPKLLVHVRLKRETALKQPPALLQPWLHAQKNFIIFTYCFICYWTVTITVLTMPVALTTTGRQPTTSTAIPTWTKCWRRQRNPLPRWERSWRARLAVVRQWQTGGTDICCSRHQPPATCGRRHRAAVQMQPPRNQPKKQTLI